MIAPNKTEKYSEKSNGKSLIAETNLTPVKIVMNKGANIINETITKQTVFF